MFARLYAIGAAVVLVLAVMLDASFYARFRFEYGFSSRIHLPDVVKMIRAFSPADLDWGWFGTALAILTSATFLVALWPRLLSPKWRLALAAPQLALIPIGFLAIISVTFDVWPNAGPDAEWLYASWPVVDAFGFWAPVPLAVYLRAAQDWPEPQRNLTA